MSNKREDCLRFLKTAEREKWFGTSNGYGCAATMYFLMSYGLGFAGNLTGGESFHKITEEDYDKLKKMLMEYHDIDINEIEGNNEFDFDKLHPAINEEFEPYEQGDGEPNIIKMLQQNCEVGVEYILDYHEFFEPECDLVIEWEEMSDGELKEWAEVLKYIRMGYESWYELPENQ